MTPQVLGEKRFEHENDAPRPAALSSAYALPCLIRVCPAPGSSVELQRIKPVS
jgi:hypothetical protein